MDIKVNKNSSTPIYKQIKNIIKDKIITGELAPGFHLPSERRMAQDLNIHRNTVVKAYEELIEEDLVIVSRKAPKGYFVGNDKEKDAVFSNLTQNGYSPLSRIAKPDFLYAYNEFNRWYLKSYTENAINMAGMLMKDETMPMDQIKQIMQEITASDSLLPFAYCEPQGMEYLRTSIANMLDKRNICVTPQNIQIVSETYQVMNLLVETYMEKGDAILIEEPISADIVGVFADAGASIVTVPREPDGISIELLEKAIQKHQPKLIYVMPDGHNPTGGAMSLENRKDLIDCANRYGIPILEEGYLSDFNYEDRQIPSLFTLDYRNSVIYMDTSQLSFYMGVRVAYMVAPENVIDACQQIIDKDQFFINTLSQYMWAKFIDEGHYETHKTFLQDYYRKKRDLLCSELAKIPDIEFEKPQMGLVIWCRLPENVHEKQLVYRAEKNGLLLMPGYLFYPYGNRGEHYIRLAFSGVSDEEIVKGVEILKDAIEACKY